MEYWKLWLAPSQLTSALFGVMGNLTIGKMLNGPLCNCSWGIIEMPCSDLGFVDGFVEVREKEWNL